LPSLNFISIITIHMQDFSGRYKLFSNIVDLNVFGTRKLARYLSRLTIPAPKGVETIKTLLGFNMIVDPLSDKNGIEHELYYKGIYEKETMHIIKSCVSEGDTFIDVGANIGVVSLYASVCVGRSGKVLSYEANPDTAILLKNNIKLNNFSNITVCEYALGSQEGKGEIYPETIKNNRGGASMVKRDGQGKLKYDIDIKKLDDVIGSDKPRMMKVDVEGWELEVLKGSQKLLSGPDAPILIVESFLHRENTIGSPTDIYKYLRSVNDYSIYKPEKGTDRVSQLVKINAPEELPEEDNIICIPQSKLASVPRSLFK